MAQFTQAQLAEIKKYLPPQSGDEAIGRLESLSRPFGELVALARHFQKHGRSAKYWYKAMFYLDRYTWLQITTVFALKGEETWDFLIATATLRRSAADIVDLAQLKVGDDYVKPNQMKNLEGMPNVAIQNVIDQAQPSSWRFIVLVKETGDKISNAMRTANSRMEGGRIGYPSTPVTYPSGMTEDFPDGVLDDSLWDYCTKWSFTLKPGVDPVDAIAAVFIGYTRLECLGMVYAVLIKGLCDVMPAALFNAVFRWKSDADPGLYVGIQDTPGNRIAKYLKYPNAGRSRVSTVDGLIKGDWIYFQNNTNYLKKHPTGAWQGENCVYDGNNLFSGFGLPRMSVNDMTIAMRNSFNQDPGTASVSAAYQVMKIRSADVPGLDFTSLVRFDFGMLNTLTL